MSAREVAERQLARSLCDHANSKWPAADQCLLPRGMECDHCLETARHAITQAIHEAEERARREALEEAAKVAEHTLVREPAGWPLRNPTPQEIAAAIRNLQGGGDG